MMVEETQHTLENIYPFKILHIFFMRVNISRPDLVPEDGFPLGLNAEIALGFPDQEKQYHIHVRVQTTEDSLPGLDIDINAVGVFEYLNEGEPGETELVEFINNNLLVALNSRIIQLLATTTAQMGMPPIWMPTPRKHGFDIDILKNLLETRQERLDL